MPSLRTTIPLLKRQRPLARAPNPEQKGASPLWRYAVLGGVLGLTLALLIWAPARWLAWGIAHISQGQVQWQDARGTVWAGSTRLVLSGGGGSRDSRALPGRLHWTLTPTWTGLRLGWTAECCMDQTAHLQLQVGAATLSLRAGLPLY
jgi:general secretion pathway protein N